MRESYFIEFADNIRPHLTTAKLAVTGGFRSVKGAAGAIKDKSCDFIGLARPLTAEPSLTKSFLEGSKSKAKENLVPTPLQTGSSVMQLSGKFFSSSVYFPSIYMEWFQCPCLFLLHEHFVKFSISRRWYIFFSARFFFVLI